MKEPGICYLLKWDLKEVIQRFNRCPDSTKISSLVLEKNKEWQSQVFFCAFGGTGKEGSAVRLRNLTVWELQVIQISNEEFLFRIS